MRTFTATFPLRTIELQMQDIPQTPTEAEAFILYGNLHNELWCLKMHWLKCIKSVEHNRTCLQQCEADYTAMETEAKRYGPIGGYTEEEIVSEEAYTLKLGDLQNLIEVYASRVQEYNEGNVAIMDMYKDGEKLDEAFSQSLLHFDKNYFSTVIHDYDNVQVHTASLDRDFDNFRKCCEEVEALYDSFCKQWEALNPIADALSAKTKATNRHLQIIHRAFEVSYTGSLDNSKAPLN